MMQAKYLNPQIEVLKIKINRIIKRVGYKSSFPMWIKLELDELRKKIYSIDYDIKKDLSYEERKLWAKRTD